MAVGEGSAEGAGTASGPVDEAIALADRAGDREVGPVERPIEPIGYAGGVFPAVVAREAVEREEIAVLEVDRARILIRNIDVWGRRGQHQLHTRLKALDAAKKRADEWPFDVGGKGPDRARVPPVGAAVDRHGRTFGIVRMVDVASGISG